MTYRLAIDYGTSYSGAAIADLPGGEPRTVFTNGRPTIPSLVVLDARSGELLTGETAENAAAIRPEMVIRSPKRYLGRREPLFREPRIEPEDAVAATLRALLAEAAALRDRRPPAEVRLTHPARWASARRAALAEAARRAGIEDPVLLPEPVAAALRFAAGETIEPGQFVAVYDLGAGTFDTAVLERTADGFGLVGEPGGLELGGESFDERLYQHLGRQLDPADWDALQNSTERVWRNAQADFRRWIRLAKEALSGNPRGVDVRYPGPADHDPLWLTADELNEQLRPDLAKTVDELDRTIAAAGLTPSRLAAVYLAGGSSKIPLVETLIVHRFGLSARLEDDRKQVVALGAAGAPAAAIEGPPRVLEPVAPKPPEPEPAPAPEPEPQPEPRPTPEPEAQPQPEPVRTTLAAVVPEPPTAPTPASPPPGQALVRPPVGPTPPVAPFIPPARNAEPRRRTQIGLGLIAGGAIAAVVVLVAAVPLLGLIPGTSPNPSASSGNTAAAVALKAAIPAAIRDECLPLPNGVAPGGGELAGLGCDGVPDPGHFVKYFLFDGDDEMEAAFDAFVSRELSAGHTLDTRCKPRWTIGSSSEGDLACIVSGPSQIAWTTEGASILGYALRPDDDLIALTATWETLGPGGPGVALTASPTPTPTPTPTPQPTPGLPYAEDFANEAETAFPWDIGGGGIYTQEFRNGSYYMQVDDTYYLTGGPRELDVGETRVQANGSVLRGSPFVGLVCRGSGDLNSFYSFEYSPLDDGFLSLSITKRVDEKIVASDGASVTEDTFGPNPLIGMLCLGTSPVTIIGFLNGKEQLRWTFDDAAPASGRVGLYVSSAGADAEALFDNFLVAEP